MQRQYGFLTTVYFTFIAIYYYGLVFLATISLMCFLCVFDFTIQASAIPMKLIQKTSNLLCKYIFLLLFFLFFLKQWYIQFLHT